MTNAKILYWQALGVLPNAEQLQNPLLDEMGKDKVPLQAKQGTESREQQGEKARMMSLGGGLAALPKKTVEKIIGLDFNELPPAKGKVSPTSSVSVAASHAPARLPDCMAYMCRRARNTVTAGLHGSCMIKTSGKNWQRRQRQFGHEYI